MFDIDKNKLDDTAELEVHDEIGQPSGAFITVASPDSDIFRAVQLEQRQRIMKAMADGRKVSEDQEAMDADTVDFLVGVTVGWRGFTASGEEFQFTVQNCKKLYRNAPFVRRQIDEFLGNRRNFKTS